jgi:hypothetical protein
MRQGRRSGGGKNRPNRGGGDKGGGGGGRRDQRGQDQRKAGRDHGSQARHGKHGKDGGRQASKSLPSLIESPIRMSGKGLPPVEEHRKLPPRKYGVVFFDTLAAARNDIPRLQDLARGYDQLNIVIRAEASMDDPELAAIGKVFAGAAWALIHDRRVAEGWYNEVH